MGVARKDILNGWKEIAGYVARDIRTVERWEKQRGLPVRRVPGAGRATVYARISELEEWLASAKPEFEIVNETQESGQGEADSHGGNGAGILTLPSAPFADGRTAGNPEFISHTATAPQHTVSRAWAGTAIALVCILGIGGAFWFHHNRHTPVATASTVSPGQAASYASKVPGVEDLYLRGTYFYERRTPEALNRGLESFQQAIQRDPSYAPAYAGLANTYNLLREYSVMPDAEAYPKAKAAAERAIALDPNLAQAYVSLGFADFFWYLDAKGAEQEFKTAITLDPNLAQAHHWYGSMLTHEGRYAEALHELDIAQHLQPTSAAILTTRALALGMSGHADQARDMLDDLLQHDPASDEGNLVTVHSVLGTISLLQPRDFPGFFAEGRRIAEMHKNKEAREYVETAMAAYKRGGERAMWRAILAREERLHPNPGDRTFRMVQCEANLGDLDSAFADLNVLVQRRDPSLDGISMDPLLAPVRRDPRFAEVRARMDWPAPS
ncbi:MAG TPA: hypothetical protein VGN16_11995 [Acidobacteriaceae bacterium]